MSRGAPAPRSRAPLDISAKQSRHTMGGTACRDCSTAIWPQCFFFGPMCSAGCSGRLLGRHAAERDGDAETAGQNDAGALENAYRCACSRCCSHFPCGLCAGHILLSAVAAGHYAELLGQQRPAKQGCDGSQWNRPPLRRPTLPHAQPSSSVERRPPCIACVTAPRLPCTEPGRSQYREPCTKPTRSRQR